MQSTISKSDISNPTITKSVRDFVRDNQIASISNTVRVNVNGYPYVTFINQKNEAENIYFSKNAGQTVREGQEIKKGFFENLCIKTIYNEAGEERLKLSLVGESTRTSIDDVL